MKNMLDALFPDDAPARNRRYAAEDVARIEADIAAGRCDDNLAYWEEQLFVMKGFRDAQ